MLTTKLDILNAIVNNLENWDWNVNSSYKFEKEECDVILALAKSEKQFSEDLKAMGIKED